MSGIVGVSVAGKGTKFVAPALPDVTITADVGGSLPLPLHAVRVKKNAANRLRQRLTDKFRSMTNLSFVAPHGIFATGFSVVKRFIRPLY